MNVPILEIYEHQRMKEKCTYLFLPHSVTSNDAGVVTLKWTWSQASEKNHTAIGQGPI
jgi:hypothetical protein